MLDDGKIIYDGALKSLKEKWGEGKEIEFQFLEEVGLADLNKITASSEVKWEKDEKEAIFTAFVEDNDELISLLIAKVVADLKVKDINIKETSTEEIIRNIYDRGIS
jgi:ABC-2 type transport system ATP-binding protein